jgi:hypothetical protein
MTFKKCNASRSRSVIVNPGKPFKTLPEFKSCLGIRRGYPILQKLSNKAKSIKPLSWAQSKSGPLGQDVLHR